MGEMTDSLGSERQKALHVFSSSFISFNSKVAGYVADPFLRQNGKKKKKKRGGPASSAGA